MSSTSLPTTMKAWQWSTAKPQLQKHLNLNPETPTAVAKNGLKKDDILIKVLSSSLNPADYKVPEGAARIMFTVPAIPGFDFCGRVVALGSDVAANNGKDSRKITEGTLVFGATPPFVQYGALAEYLALPASSVGVLPEGVDIDQAATIGIAGETAYQSLLQGDLKEGDHIFINGGSTGCGVYAIQIAKILGLKVTTSCSERNVGLVKELGADEVLDYTKEDIVVQLKKDGQVFDFVCDVIGRPFNLYKESHHFLKPGKVFSEITVDPPLVLVKNMFLPSCLGGGKRKWNWVLCRPNTEHLDQLAQWIQEGKIKVPIDSVWEFEDVPKAYEKLRTSRAKGKIVVHVSKE